MIYGVVAFLFCGVLALTFALVKTLIRNDELNDEVDFWQLEYVKLRDWCDGLEERVVKGVLK